MLSTFRLDFDHDCPDKTERFRAFAAALSVSGCFDEMPLVIDTPVFSYRRVGRSQLDSLIHQVGKRPTIAFLSDICSYSFAMVQAAAELSRGLNLFSEYESLSSFVESPNLQGHAVSTDGTTRLVDNDCLVIGMMPYSCSSELLDDEADQPNTAVVDVIQELGFNGGSVYAYRIRDEQRYFKEIVFCDYPVYVIRSREIEVTTALQHFCDETLTEYLLSLPFPFGTLNDNHQDDYFAVSYRRPVWRAAKDTLAFVA